MLSLLLLNLQGAFMGYMASSSFFLALVVLIPTSVSFGGLWRARTADFQIQRLCFSGLSICNRYSPSTCVKAVVGHQVETITPCRRAWTGRSRTAISFSMGYGGGATNRYSWQETEKELNVMARLPAWAKGKSVRLELGKTHIKLFLKEEEDKPIIEGDLRGIVRLDGSYWTMESLDDGGKMLYLTLEKIPELTGLGPWMGVVQEEEQVTSDYPEEKKAAELAAKSQKGDKGTEDVDDESDFFEDPDPSKPRHTGEVDEDGFCQDLMAVQGMSAAMIARQVPRNGNALFSAVSASVDYHTTGEHLSVEPKAIELKAKELRKRAIDYLADAYKQGKQIFLEGNAISARELVGAQAKARNMVDGDEYLRAMRDDTTWGAGAEVVALTHVLERPIHVYELKSTGLRFGVDRIGAFGTPQYRANEVVHLLSTYGRFPELDPGSQTGEGNHFLPLFPEAWVPEKNKR